MTFKKKILTAIISVAAITFTTIGVNAASACQHDWVPNFKTVHHDAETHYETGSQTADVLTAGDYWTDYQKLGCKCQNCDWYILYEDYNATERYEKPLDHEEETGHTVDISVFITDPDEPQYYVEPKYETEERTKTVTITDVEAYDEEILTGYTCSKCGKTKTTSLG